VINTCVNKKVFPFHLPKRLFYKFSVNLPSISVDLSDVRLIREKLPETAGPYRKLRKKAGAQWGLENKKFTKLNTRSRGLWHPPEPLNFCSFVRQEN